MIDRIRTCAKKIKAIEYLGNKCQICNEESYYKLCFHHKKEKEKEFDWNRLKDSSWIKIENELKKCILLCYNCHHKIHTDINTHNQDNKKIILEFIGIKSCEICGYNENVGSLDFHHKNKDEKEFEISSLTARYGVIEIKEKIENELNKCQILCKNCHMELHYNDGFLVDNYTEIMKKSNNLKVISPKINKETVKTLYNSGKKQIEIAKILNCKKSTICGIIKQLKNLKN